MTFDPVDHAQSELAPLLTSILMLLEDEGSPDQERFFRSILDSIRVAREAEDLAGAFMQLSMSAFMGFRFSPSVALLLDRLLAQSQELTEVLALDESEIQ